MNNPRSNQNLTRSLSHGGAWMVLLRSGDKIFNFIKLIVLARLLKPYDFGVVAVAMVLSSALDAFSQTGFIEALIQKKERDKAYSDCTWTILLVRGVILAGFMSFFADTAAQIFKISAVSEITQLLAICFTFQAFTNIGVIHFLKELDFKKYFAYNTLATIGDFIVSIAAAIYLRNALALVFGMLTRDLLKLIISYMLSPYRPRFCLNPLHIKELFKFGKWMFGSSIFGFAISQIDSIMVARFLGASAVGSYQMAQKISNVPATEITHIINQLTLPVYSKIQDNTQRLKVAYLKVLELCSFFIFFLAGLIMIMGEDFINIFLGRKWGSLAWILIIMAVAGTLRAIAATTGTVFLAIGRPKIDTFWQSVRLAVIAALIYPLACWWGTVGAAIALFLSTTISAIGLCYSLIHTLNCGGRNFIKAISTCFLSAVAGSLLIYFLKKNLISVDIVSFFALCLAFAAAYAVCTLIIDKWLGYNLSKIFKELHQQFLPEKQSS